MRLLSAVVLGAVFVVVGCNSSDPGSASLQNGSTVAEPTSTLPAVEPLDDNEVADGDQQPGILLGPWLLISGSVDEQPIPTEPDLVMRFGETILRFPLACNSGSIPYEVDGTSIEFDVDHSSTTLEACAPDPTGQAELFVTGLHRVQTATRSAKGQQLHFEGPGVSMQFARGIGGDSADTTLTPTTTTVLPTTSEPSASVEAPELADTSWNVIAYRLPDGSITNVSKADVTISFFADGTMSGSAGCNSYNSFDGTWSVSGTWDAFEPGVSDSNDGQELVSPYVTANEMLCEDDAVMEQEAVFLDLLQDAGRWVLIDGEFNLRDAEGGFLFSAEPL